MDFLETSLFSPINAKHHNKYNKKFGMVQKEAFLGNKKGCGIMPLEYV
jgi:hypothetical protein